MFGLPILRQVQREKHIGEIFCATFFKRDLVCKEDTHPAAISEHVVYSAKQWAGKIAAKSAAS